ncbi:MAG: flagellar basal body-associated FliL family protein [Selenomonadaceae bacterium]|nr:flagellar basal body-associated FliL family protein [Selenomonadaceae bacterium]
MADEEKDVESTPEPKKKSPIILIVVLVVVGLALAAGISIFVTTKIMADANAEQDEGEGRHHDAGIFIKLGDPKEGMLVNVGGPRAGKYLKAGIVLEMNPGKKSVINEETKTLQPDAQVKIDDMVTQFLRATKVEDFDATKQDELKKQLKDALNAELGSGAVYDIYITSFLLQ